MPEAELSWGFCIPNDKLAALVLCLRQHDPNYVEIPRIIPLGVRWVPRPESGLQEYLEKFEEDPRFSAFDFKLVYQEGRGDGVVLMITHAQSKKETEGVEVEIESELYDAASSQDLVRQLEVDLHLAEADIEVPVKEQWYLAIKL